MNELFFITLAYGLTGGLLAMLCLGTWLRARATRRELDRRRAP